MPGRTLKLWYKLFWENVCMIHPDHSHWLTIIFLHHGETIFSLFGKLMLFERVIVTAYQWGPYLKQLYNLRKINKEIFHKSVWYWESTPDNTVPHGCYQDGSVTIHMSKQVEGTVIWNWRILKLKTITWQYSHGL